MRTLAAAAAVIVCVAVTASCAHAAELKLWYAQPAPLEPNWTYPDKPNAQTKGWVEALQKMKVGEKWQLFVPPHLAYKLEPPGPPIEPNSMLVFEIELTDIVQP